MTSKRLFLALELSEPDKQYLDQWQAQHFKCIEQSPIPPANYHITLVFLGHTDALEEQLLVEKLKQVSSKGFELTINQTAYWTQPKLIYLAPTHPPSALIQLQQQLNDLVKQIGLTSEERVCQPHMSLYRKITPSIFAGFEKEAGIAKPNLSLTIKHFALYQSVSTPNGAAYPVLERFDLG
jgi:2'-5' RNA ligase